MSRVRLALTKYMALRQSGFFKRNPEINQQYGDIGRIKTLSDLEVFLSSLDGLQTISNTQADREKEAAFFASREAVLLLDNESYRIVIPETQEASCWFGRNTQWCTASTEADNYFDDYHNDGNLYIILDKKNNRRWQWHFITGQYMDERDENIVWKTFPKEIIGV